MWKATCDGCGVAFAPDELRWQVRVGVGGGNPSRIMARRYLCQSCAPPELVAWYRELGVDARDVALSWPLAVARDARPRLTAPNCILSEN